MALTRVKSAVALVWVGLAGLLTGAGAGAAPVFVATDLNKTQGFGQSVDVGGMNNLAQVAGQVRVHGNPLRDIGVLLGPDGQGHDVVPALGPKGATLLNAINDSGLAVGCSSYRLDAQVLPVMTAPGGRTLVEIATPFPVQTGCARAVNASGQVVGEVTITYARAFITGPGGTGMQALGTLGGMQSWAEGVNSLGEVVGSAETASGRSLAFVTGPHGQGMRSLGTFGGRFSVAHAINERGQVAGSANVNMDGQWAAFVTGPHGLNKRRLVPTSPDADADLVAINRHGVAVGEEKTVRDGLVHRQAVITGPAKRLLPLSAMTTLPPGVRLTSALAINDRGEIVARGSNGHVFLLAPVRTRMAAAAR